MSDIVGEDEGGEGGDEYKESVRSRSRDGYKESTRGAGGYDFLILKERK